MKQMLFSLMLLTFTHKVYGMNPYLLEEVNEMKEKLSTFDKMSLGQQQQFLIDALKSHYRNKTEIAGALSVLIQT